MTDRETETETPAGSDTVPAPGPERARAGNGDGTGAPEGLLGFVEQFALVLAEGGLARMPARVFAYVLAEDRHRYTARDLAEGLGVSPAAISGAVRQLVQSGLLIRERAPGARADHYRIDDDDIWATIFAQRLPLLDRWDEQLARGIELLGGTRGGDRLVETRAYVRFLREQFDRMLAEWPRRRQELVAELAGPARRPDGPTP